MCVFLHVRVGVPGLMGPSEGYHYSQAATYHRRQGLPALHGNSNPCETGSLFGFVFKKPTKNIAERL